VSSSSSPEPFAVDLGTGQAVTACHYAAELPAAPATLVFAPGAGSAQRHPSIVAFARALAADGFDVVTFDFPYREQNRRIPDPAPVLEACYASAIAAATARLESARRALFIGGRSMGGRMATQAVARWPHLPVAGLVLLGYPLHPPGNPSKRRDAHLPAVGRPMLVVQGSRDTFGTPEEIGPVFDPLPSATVHVVAGADHSLKVSRVAARQAAADEEIRRVVRTWMLDVTRGTGATPTPQP